MWLCQSKEAYWYCKCVENSNSNVTAILDLNWPSTTLSTNVETMFTQLSQHWSPVMGTNIHTMFTQHCLNIVSTSVSNVGHWCSHNIWMLSQHRSATLRVMLPQHSQHCLKVVWTLADIGRCCNNSVAMLGFWLKYNVYTTLTQHCLDINTMLLGCLKVSTFERCLNVGTEVELVSVLSS